MSGIDWKGENPYYLTIRHRQEDGAVVGTVVDLDEPGWTKTYADVLRLPGRWYLVDKETGTYPIALAVAEGEQPYYKARHVAIGSGLPGMTSEVIAYGLGKKRLDGHVDRLWHFRGGLTVAGDDVNPIGIEVIKMLAAKKQP